MKSKGYQRFSDRLNHFLIDCEMVDILVIDQDLLAGTEKIFANVTNATHPKLNHRQNNTNSRELVVTHLRNTVFVSFIKDLYEEVTEYLKYILREAALNGAEPGRLIGDHNCNIKANCILSRTTREEIVEMVMSIVFQSLENERSTLELLRKIQAKLGLDIDERLIDDALPYLEIRHVFVHSDGKPNPEIRHKYHQFTLRPKTHRIELNLSVIKTAFEKVNNLLLEYDQKMIEKNFISSIEQIA